jgi:hypothetical protein
VKTRFQAFAFKCNSCRYNKVRAKLMLSPDVAGAVKRWWKELGAVGLCVALRDAHWPALYVNQ